MRPKTTAMDYKINRRMSTQFKHCLIPNNIPALIAAVMIYNILKSRKPINLTFIAF